ncbi:MAG: thioredoxin-like domain-containing protein [Verrucomicrobiota bacterium]
MKPIKFTLLIIACAALLFTPGQAFALELDKLNKDLVRVEGDKLKKVKDVDLTSKKYVAFYYSAHWCPPCRAFTPKLSEFYDEMKEKHGDDFELVFVSSDQSEKKMQEYMEWGNMNFPALDFKDAQGKDIQAVSASGIPYLLVVDKDGKEVLGKGSEDWISPSGILSEFEKLLK